MNATEIQTLEVARELALKKITDNRVNRFSSGTKLIFSRVDVTLTRDNVDVTKDFNLHLEYLEEEGEICVKCFSQKSKNQYDVVFFYISGDDAISIVEGNEYRNTRSMSIEDPEIEREFCLTIKAI